MPEDSSNSATVPASQFEKMAELYRVWEALPGDRPRAALDPLTLGSRLIRHVSIGSFVDGCTDFRYDLIGSEMQAVAPRLSPGARSSDSLRIQMTRYDLIHDLFLSTGRRMEPKVLRIHYASMENMPRGIYALFLPLGRQTDADGEEVASDMMIGLWRFEPEGPLKQDSYEDLADAFAAYRATRRDV